MECLNREAAEDAMKISAVSLLPFLGCIFGASDFLSECNTKCDVTLMDTVFSASVKTIEGVLRGGKESLLSAFRTLEDMVLLMPEALKDTYLAQLYAMDFEGLYETVSVSRMHLSAPSSFTGMVLPAAFAEGRSGGSRDGRGEMQCSLCASREPVFTNELIRLVSSRVRSVALKKERRDSGSERDSESRGSEESSEYVSAYEEMEGGSEEGEGYSIRVSRVKTIDADNMISSWLSLLNKESLRMIPIEYLKRSTFIKNPLSMDRAVVTSLLGTVFGEVCERHLERLVSNVNALFWMAEDSEGEAGEYMFYVLKYYVDSVITAASFGSLTAEGVRMINRRTYRILKKIGEAGEHEVRGKEGEAGEKKKLPGVQQFLDELIDYTGFGKFMRDNFTSL